MKMEQTECSETSAYKIQTPGNHPEENIQHTEHGEVWNQKHTSCCNCSEDISVNYYVTIVLKHLTFVTLPDIVTTTMTIPTSLVFYLYMDIWKIKWMNEYKYSGISRYHWCCFSRVYSSTAQFIKRGHPNPLENDKMSHPEQNKIEY
jgi:hypothetical protein